MAVRFHFRRIVNPSPCRNPTPHQTVDREARGCCCAESRIHPSAQAFGAGSAPGYHAGSTIGERSMSKANVDPAELRRFALDLKRFTDEIESLVGQMHGRMNALEASWRDQEQKKFAETFFQTTKALALF